MIRSVVLVATSVLCLVLVPACGDDGEPPVDPPNLSCTFDMAPDAGMSAGATCLEYRGELSRADCPSGAGYVETESCPPEGRLATCVTRNDTSIGYAETILIVYEEGALDSNEESCLLSGGRWTLTPVRP